MGKTILKRAALLSAGVLCTMTSLAQSVVQGTVKDKSGEPLIGATIQIKGQQGGTVTDLDGDWKLTDARPGQVIVISYVGYANKEITLGSQKSLNIILEPDKQDLDEVVVVGYAIGSKRTVSGAVERVGRKDMNKGVVTNAADALKGKVSGVVISQSGGDPMGTTNIRVRGTSSLSGGNDPLVIIDGVYGDMTMFNALQPVTSRA